MSLVRWFRKNNTKVMAVVVIVLMIGFIGGSSLTYMLQGNRGRNETLAYIAEGIKVKQSDLDQANMELEILKILGLDNILKMLQAPMLNTLDLHAFLLSELLFTEQGPSPEVISYLEQIIGTNLYRISPKQINDMYKRSMPSSIYWFCLSNEAQSAGVKVPNESAGEFLGRAIPQLFNGQSYSQVISSIVNRYGVPEQQILATCAKLLSVLECSQMICSGQNITSRQLKHTMAYEIEGVDVDFVEFDSTVFARVQEAPDEQTMLEHFNMYKGFFSGDVSDSNPYGFGYKLPDRVRLEYIALKLSDISPIVIAPTQDELEDYYDRNKEQLFTEQIRSDPNDPNSPLITRIKPYSTVAAIISRQIKQDKVDAQAESILQEARTLTETSFKDFNDMEVASLSSQEYAEMAGDYKAVAEQLSEKYNINVYSGQTGLLNAIEIRNDEYLSRLYLQSSGSSFPVSLAQIVFAVDGLAASEIELYNVQKPRLYQNIGPLEDLFGLLQEGTGQIMVLVRVTEALKAVEPEGLNHTYSINSLVFDPNQQEAEKEVFSVREKISEDLRNLAAMEGTRVKAEEFIELAEQQGWDVALDKFNELYKPEDIRDTNELDIIAGTDDAQAELQETFKLENQKDLRRISGALLDTLAVQMEGNPGEWDDANERRMSGLWVEQLYSLIPADGNEQILPLIMEFKPRMCYYCIKDINLNRLWEEDYEKSKAIQLYKEDFIQSQSLSAVYLNPENILKRTKFRLVTSVAEETAESDSQTGSQEAL